ncbi:hypothetical protein SEPB62_22213 [Salmonella enterica subsp. enterica serovar Paratyphi B str. SARA62]|nr:hypothetical protein SEEM710_00942 [Salmonella enterica subsp. enterica serovar Montevideo str. ATCC BAA710]ELX31624.1 hypothetical protein SE451239_06007 [Salmonella enterica subsp. enterica serovar 4 [Salmonella enterica subsp. enterica serovar 4 [Salmonella enterica subsp. enterica serovar 4,[5],12:i:- str. 08-1739]ESE71964.1 hypothetical protein SEPB62_22213 [Salmonella enterica subsp. enterica serovar Paratyphi B str. SARA62]KMT73971.1 hypothetical protein SEEN6805_17892 [Salmonella ente
MICNIIFKISAIFYNFRQGVKRNVIYIYLLIIFISNQKYMFVDYIAFIELFTYYL